MNNRGRVKPILILVIALGGGAVGAFVSYGAVRRGGGASAKEDAPPKPVTFVYSLGEITVNLNQPGRYLQAGVDLEVLAYAREGSGKASRDHGDSHSDASRGTADQGQVILVAEHGGKEKEEEPLSPSAAILKDELDEMRPKIMDCVIETLSSHSFEDVLLPQGKRKLRERLIESVNSILENGEVKSVYFTTFLAQ